MKEIIDSRFVGYDAELTMMRRAMGSGPRPAEPTSQVKVPNPKAFSGTRNAKELENFLWDMEQYFAAAKIAEDQKVSITSMYLAGDAKLWWRTRLDDDAEAGRPKIETWEALRKELREQFLPFNTAWNARESLKRLKHSGSVREYVKEFTSIMLDIKNMSEDDKLFNFLSGLQTLAQTDLRRQVVKDLPSAIAASKDWWTSGRPPPLPPHKKGRGRRTTKTRPHQIQSIEAIRRARARENCPRPRLLRRLHHPAGAIFAKGHIG